MEYTHIVAKPDARSVRARASVTGTSTSLNNTSSTDSLEIFVAVIKGSRYPVPKLLPIAEYVLGVISVNRFTMAIGRG